MESNSIFDKLSAINVNDKVEKKSNLTYLSWAWAWAEVKKACPDATYEVLQDPYTSKPYFFDDNLGYMVMTQVTIEGESLEMWLPVMDGANKAMTNKSYTYSTRYGDKTVEKATMFDINKTLMRCLTKNLAMFGLGLYIYAGEDLPETIEQVKTPQHQPIKEDLPELKKGSEDWNKVVNYINTNKSLGMEKLGKQLNRRYKMSAIIKKEIANIVSAE